MIAFSCQKCGKQFNLKPEFAGRTTTCSGCKEPIVVPASDSPETIAPVARARISFSCAKCGIFRFVDDTHAAVAQDGEDAILAEAT